MGLLDYNIEPETKRKNLLPATPSVVNPNQGLIDSGKAIALERAGGSKALLHGLTDNDYIEMERARAKKEEHGFVGEVAAGLGRGALRVAATPAYLADVAGEAVGWKGLERAGEWGAEKVEKFIEESPRLRKSASISGDIRDNPQLWTDPKWYASIVSEGAPTIASMFIPGMAAARAARAAGMGAKAVQAARMGGALAAGMGLEAGGAAEDIRQYEKRTGEKVPISTKLKTVTGTGVIAGSLEAIPVFNIFGSKVAKKLIGRIITSMALEGGTEGAQEIVANAFAKVGYDADRDMVGGVIESVVGGVLLGGGMGAMQQTFQERIQNTDSDKVADLLEQAEKEITTEQQTVTIFNNMLDEGMATGEITTEIDGVTTKEAFTPETAIEVIRQAYADEILTDENIDQFKEKYPALQSGLNEIIGDNVAGKINQEMEDAEKIRRETEEASAKERADREAEERIRVRDAEIDRVGAEKKKAEEAVKPRHEMTLDEFVEETRKFEIESGMSLEKAEESITRETERDSHKRRMLYALEQGEKIPRETLLEYSDDPRFAKALAETKPKKREPLKEKPYTGNIKFIGMQKVLDKPSVPLFATPEGGSIEYDSAKHKITNLAEYEKAVAVEPVIPKSAEAKPSEVAEKEIKGEGIAKPAPEAQKEPYRHRPMTVEAGAARLDDLAPTFGKDIYTKNAIQYFGTGDKTIDRETVKILQSLKGKPEQEISVYRSVEKDAKVDKLVAGDWVTINKEYARQHGESILEGNYKIIEQKVKAKDLTTNADSFNEQGYYPVKPKVEKEKVEVAPEKKETKPTEPTTGFAWIKGKQKPIMFAREIKSGKNEGKYQVTLTKGRDADGNIIPGTKKIIEAKDIITMPGVEKEVKPAEKPAEVRDEKKFATKETKLREDFQGRVTAGQEIIDEIKNVGRQKTINPDGTITLYHGTSPANALIIKKKGLQSQSYLSLTKKETLEHIRQHDKKEIMEINVDARDVEFSTGTQEFYAPDGLTLDKDRIWKSPERIKTEIQFATKATKPQETITRKDLREIFTRMKNVVTGQDLKGNFFFRVAGRPRVTIYTVNEIEGYIDTSSGRIPVGSFLHNKMELKTSGVGPTADVITAWHEFNHMLEDNHIISGNDVKVLSEAVAKDLGINVGAVTSHQRGDYIGKIIVDWKTQANTRIKRILKKISDFMDTVWEFVSRTRTAEGVIRDIESGKILAGKKEAVAPVKTLVPAFQQTAERFYSQVVKTVQAKMPAKMQASDVMNWLRKQPGIKAAELEWMDVEAMLEGKKTVGRDELVGLLKENQVVVEEVVKGKDVFYTEKDLDYQGVEKQGSVSFHIFNVPGNVLQLPVSKYKTEKEAREYALTKIKKYDTTKFAEYQLEGEKENYRELLFKLPAIPEVPFDEWVKTESKGTYPTSTSFHQLPTHMQKTLMDRFDKYETPKTFKSTHWPEDPNTFAHVRVNERTDVDGDKILFVEEIQSDWEQAIRKGERVPDMPFKKNWHEVVLKRIIRMAAEQGIDKVAWITGQQTADRYDLSKQVDSVRVVKRASGYEFYAKKDGENLVSKQKLNEKELAENIGKGLAEKAVKDLEGQEDQAMQTYSGLDLKIGGEWAYRLYGDSEVVIKKEFPNRPDMLKYAYEGKNAAIVPQYLKKFGKKWEAAVEAIEIETGGERIGKYVGPELDTGDLNAISPDRLNAAQGSQLREVGSAMEEDGLSFKKAMEEYGSRGLAEIVGGKFDTRKEVISAQSFTITPELKRATLFEGMPLFQTKPTPEYEEMLKRYQKAETTKAKAKTDRLSKASLNQKTKQGITATQEITDSPSSPEGFNMPSEGKGRQALDTIQWKMQDRLIHLKKVQTAIETEKSIELPDSSNVYQTEELYHYKTTKRIKDADRDLFDPLTESIAKSVYDLEDVELFLRARHAPEANKQLQEINPKRENNTALSGMSNTEAGKIMEQYGKDADMLDIANQIDAITKGTRQIMVNDGLATKNEIKAWENAYKFYIPLKREGKGSEMPKKGRGMYVGGKESKMRLTGSEELKPVNIVANIMAQHEATIIRAEKAKVGRAMLKLATEHPNKDLWVADAPELKPFLKQRKDDARQLDLFTGLPGALSEVVYGKDILYKFADNVLVTKIDGIEHTVTFNDQNIHSQRIVKSLKNLGADNSNAVLNVLSKVNRVLAMVNTSYNPEFIISNLARDIQTAGYNINDTEARGVKAKIFKDVFKALTGIRRGVRGKYDTEWAKNYEAFEKAGAQTGWIDYHKNIEAREKTLKKKLAILEEGNWPAMQRAFKSVFEFIDYENTAVENAIRLSTFKHLKDIGISDARAASAAKNLTVNFNRRGDAGQAMNALYLFFNANAQGSVRLIYAAAKSPTVRKMMFGTVAFAVMLDMLNRSIGGDDDDGEKKYDKVPTWVKEHNMVIMRPNGDYFKVPLPWGYNTLHVLGQVIGESVDPSYQKDFSAIASAGRVGGAVLGSFNPLGSESSLLQIVSPTIIDPFIQWSENKNFAGIPLRPEQNPFDVPKPEYQMYFRNAREPSKWIAKQLNDLTGGDITKPGLVDVSPEVFDLFIDTFTGGAGKFIDNTLRIPKTLIEEDIDVRHIPFVRRMYGEPSEFAARTTFYDNLNDIRYAEKSIKYFQNIRDFNGLRQARKNNLVESKFIARAKSTKKEVDRLRKEQKQIEKSKITKEIKEKRIEIKEKFIRQKINRFNKQYFDAKYRRK